MEKALLNGDSNDISDAFRDLCREKSQSDYIKVLLSDDQFKPKFDRNVLNSGLIGALESDTEEYIHIIFSHMVENNIKNQLYTIINPLLSAIDIGSEKAVTIIAKYIDDNNKQAEDDFEYIQALFNYATSLNKDDLANTLDNNHSILKRSLSNQMPKQIRLTNENPLRWGKLKDDGSLQITGTFAYDVPKADKKAPYLFNPILFNLSAGNYELLDSFFNKGYEIHPSVIAHALVSNIYLENNEVLTYLIKNKECLNIIKNSKEIDLFLNNDEDSLKNKKLFISQLLMTELNEELNDTNPKTKNKPKI
jgi:hypothetical protein